jgi:hypothetical protein
MGATLTAISTAICMLVLLATSQFTPAIAQTVRQLAQQDHVETATASSSTRTDACSSAVDKAFNLCILRGFANISGVNCECTQGDVPGAPIWECVGTAMCKR